MTYSALSVALSELTEAQAVAVNWHDGLLLSPHHFQETHHHVAIFREHFVLKGREAAAAALDELEAKRNPKPVVEEVLDVPPSE